MNKALFKIALEYVEKEYSSEDLRYGDDLYDTSKEDKSLCVEYYYDILDKGLEWANNYLIDKHKENYVKITLSEYLNLIEINLELNYLKS